MNGVDYVVRLLLDNSKFAKSLNDSKNSLDTFKAIGHGTIGMLSKFAGTVGIAMGASQAFEKVIRGSQATSDRFDATMRVCTTSVDEFFSGLSRGDFTAFNGGLESLAQRAKEAYQAMDQLANTMISFDLASYDNQLKFDETMDKYRKEKDPKKKAEYKQQLEDIKNDQKKRATTLSHDIRKTIDTQIKEDNPWYTGKGVTDEFLRDVVKIDSDEETREAKRNYGIRKGKEFNKKKQKIWFKYLKEAEDNARRVDTKSYHKEVEELAKGYQDVFAINKLLQKDMDDKLKETKDLMKQETSAKLSVTTMLRKINAKSGEYSTGGGSGNAQANEFKKNTKEAIKILNDFKDKYNDIKSSVDSGKINLGDNNILAVELWKNIKDESEEFEKSINKIIKTGKATADEVTFFTVLKEDIEESIKKLTILDEAINNTTSISIKFDSQKSLPELMAERSILVRQLNNSQTPEDYVRIKAQLDLKDKDIEEFKSGGSDGPNIKEFEPVEEAPLTNPKKLENLGRTFSGLAKCIRSVGEAMRATGNDSKGMARAMAMVNFAASMAMLTATFVEKLRTTKNIWELIAAGIAGGAMMIKLGAQLRAINTAKYAEGGIVGGSQTIGDQNLIRVNSGEMILNKRQQRNLFNLLDTGNTGGVKSRNNEVEFKIHGRDLWGVLSNYSNKVSKVY